MTRKDYVAMARIMKNSQAAKLPAVSIKLLRDIAAQMADEMSRDNPRFDKARFMEACGFKGEA